MNVFRKEYRELSEAEKALVDKVKDIAGELYQVLEDANTPDNGRHVAIAKTELETSVMFAVKAITG